MSAKLALATLLLAGLTFFGVRAGLAQAPVSLDTAAIEQASGLKGQFISDENVFKITQPRTDVRIAVGQWAMPAFMGLGSWTAFTPAQNGVVMMGGTVVFEDEVNAAMSAAFEAGLDVTGLHNHFFYDEPKVYFMHIGATGDPRTVAAGVRKVYDKIAEIRAAHPTPAKSFGGAIGTANSIDAAPLEAVLGAGQSSQGTFKVVLGRSATMHGVPLGKEMGINTWAAFAGTDDAAVVDGDFAMLENELQPVLRAMPKEGIEILAIHQHMTQEQPRYMFLHYWGKGKAVDLAHSLQRVLQAQAAVKS